MEWAVRYKFSIAKNGFNFASMLILKTLLFPFALLYDLITRVRNHAYNVGTRHSVSFNIPVINVGNLTVGGTGKTPHVEYIVNELQASYDLAILSRGYKRSTKGFFLADEQSTANSIGDEPMQFWSKFGPKVKVAVGEDRALAIPQILHEHDSVKAIILDDAYQHRSVNPGFNILLSDYNRLFYKDILLPSGRLRESRSGANRADLVIITKCPNELSDKDQNAIEKKVRKYLKNDQEVLFSTIKYGEVRNVFNNNLVVGKKVAGLAGIAKVDLFKAKLELDFDVIDFQKFPDHHKFSKKDVENIASMATKHSIVCTEKDMVKLVGFKKELEHLPIFFIPIEVGFLGDDSNRFNFLLNKYLEKEN